MQANIGKHNLQECGRSCLYCRLEEMEALGLNPETEGEREEAARDAAIERRIDEKRDRV